MQNENENNAFTMYLATVNNLTAILRNNIIENGGQGLPTQLELDDIVCKMLQGFTASFFELGGRDKELQESDFIKMNNVINEDLLSLSSKTDFLPSNSLLLLFCKELSELMFFTHAIFTKDQEEDEE